MGCTDSNILRIGLTQSLSEGAMYTFVFMWVPTLLSLDPPGGVPTGCVFSAFMIAITIGGILFPIFSSFVLKFVSKSKSSKLLQQQYIPLRVAVWQSQPFVCRLFLLVIHVLEKFSLVSSCRNSA